MRFSERRLEQAMDVNENQQKLEEADWEFETTAEIVASLKNENHCCTQRQMT
jgi:hypothetical protein